MVSNREYKEVVYQLGELAHENEELIETVAEQMETLLAVQEMMGITEHEVKRDYFELIHGGKQTGGSGRPDGSL